jgi:hypothetical protein
MSHGSVMDEKNWSHLTRQEQRLLLEHHEKHHTNNRR